MVHSLEYLYEIIAIAGPIEPRFAPTEGAWRKLEMDLDFVFPEDYKLMLTAFGLGWFGSGLTFEVPARLWEPFSHDLLVNRREWFVELIEARKLHLYPDRGGYVYIGRMDQQAFFYRPIPGTRQLETLVHLDAETAKLYYMEEPITQFIYRLYRNISNDKRMASLRKAIWDDGKGGKLPFFTPGN